MELVEKLINDYHCDSMARDDKGATPLHIAALAGKEHVVRRLVSNYGHSVEYKVLSLLVDQFGCSPHIQDFNSRTFPYQACGDGHLESVEKLINDYYCDLNTRNDKGFSPLPISLASKRKSLVTALLLKCNCSPHICDADGNTALHGYVSQGDKDMVEILVDLIGAFPSIKNNEGKAPIDWHPLVLPLIPNVGTCVNYLSKHAVGEYRHSPQKVLVFDKEVVSSLSKYSSYSLLASPFTQSCGMCYMKDLVGTDIWVCHAAPDTQHTSVLQTLLSGPNIMAVITVSLSMATNDVVNKVLSEVFLTKQLARQDTVPLNILLTASSSFDQLSLFNDICMDVIEKANMDTSIHFSQQFLICEPEKYEERLYPVLSKFISGSVSTIRNPDIPEITHGSIYLLKYLYRENYGKSYVTFSDLKMIE